MKIFLIFLSALALGIGGGQYYIQYHVPAPAVLAVETQVPEPTSPPSPTLTPTPTSTHTPEPTLVPSPKPTPTSTPRLTPTPSVVAAATSTPTRAPTVTIIPTSTPTSAPVATVSVSYSLVLAPPDMEPVFSEMANKYHVDANLLKKIASCESHFNPGVVSQNGLYAGMFQFSLSTWNSNRGSMGMDSNPDLRFGVRESIETAAYMVSRGGASSWPECSR